MFYVDNIKILFLRKMLQYLEDIDDKSVFVYFDREINLFVQWEQIKFRMLYRELIND